MVTTSSPSPDLPTQDVGGIPGSNAGEKGFFGSLVQSIFEPGANNAVILAMNVSFFLLLIVLGGLAFLTDWDFHVMMLLGVSTLLWAAMVWFIIEMQKLPDRPDNMPIDQMDPAAVQDKQDGETTKAEPILETRKDR